MISCDAITKKIAELRATTERELLIEANKKGKWQQSVENSNPYQSHITPEQWYNETYGTDEQ